MKKYKVFITSAYMYFSSEKDALDYLKKLLAINLGGELTVKEVLKEDE